MYIDYLEESRLEDTIDAVSCSIQQQDMDALYHVKYEDEGNKFEMRISLNRIWSWWELLYFIRECYL